VHNIKKTNSSGREALINLLALTLLAMIVRKGWLDLDTNWDSLNYHLPLAALRVGLMSQHDYKLSPGIAAIYGGFPVIPDYLEGWVWRVTGRVQAANLVGMMGLLAFGGLAARWFRISFAELILCLLAIPSILIAGSSAYVDLWVNSVMAIMVVLLFRAFIKPEQFCLTDVFIALGAFSAALNSKPQFLPVGTLALAGLVLIVWVNRCRLALLREQWSRFSGIARTGLILSGAILIGTGYANTAKDWLIFHNPIYPVAFSMGPIHWTGLMSPAGSEPAYLAHTIQPVKWMLSILEYDAFEGRSPIWALDAGAVPRTSRALRMGGYFAAYVGMNLVWFAFLQRPGNRRYGWRPLVFLVCLSAVTSCLPVSHELRYYSFWMLSLIAMNLTLIREAGEAQNEPLRFLFVGGAMACLSFVVLSSGGSYVAASNLGPKELVAELGISRKLADMHLKEGEKVCVVSKAPFSFMYAPIFNPEMEQATHYREIVAENISECEDARVVP
jgi:hypothetical protein